MDPALKAAAAKAGGVPALAGHLGVSRREVDGCGRVPEDKLAEVSDLTGLTPVEFRPDLFGIAPSRATDIAEDYHAWVLHQVGLLRLGEFGALDRDNLIDEVLGLASSHRDEIESRVSSLLLHLLKWEFQPERRSNSWRASIVEARKRIGKLLAESPSLKPLPALAAADYYEVARLKASGETGLPLETFPASMPFTIEEALDPAWLPGEAP